MPFALLAFSQSTEKEKIIALENNIATSIAKHDYKYLGAAFANDIKIISATGDVADKNDMLKAVQYVTSISLSGMEVKIVGNIAIVTGIEIENGKDNIGIYSNKMRFTDILEKRNNQWQIINSQATTMK